MVFLGFFVKFVSFLSKVFINGVYVNINLVISIKSICIENVSSF